MKLSDDFQIWLENTDARHPCTVDNERFEEWRDKAAKLEAEIRTLKKQCKNIVDEFRLHIDKDSDTAEWLDACEGTIHCRLCSDTGLVDSGAPDHKGTS